ncbi:MAG: hypothetical protein WBB08_10875 [Halobacteriota archaeon]
MEDHNMRKKIKTFYLIIINALNETYGLNLTDDDKVDIERIKIKL